MGHSPRSARPARTVSSRVTPARRAPVRPRCNLASTRAFTLHAAPSYCVAPCLTNTDCPSMRASDQSAIAVACIYDPFEPLCRSRANSIPSVAPMARRARRPAARRPTPSAPLSCATTRAARVRTRRRRQRDALARINAESLICLNGSCQQLCRDDSECAGGACAARPRFASTSLTRQKTRVTIASTCRPCASHSPCARRATATVTVRRRAAARWVVFVAPFSIMTAPSALRVRRHAVGGGLALGARCASQSSCNSGLCLGAPGATVCSAACRDDGDCLAGMRCTPSTLFGTAVDTLCLSVNASLAADGAACTAFSDCQSNLVRQRRVCATVSASSARGRCLRRAG